MTVSQACRILNVKAGCSRREIEQVYKARLQLLQLQLVAGRPLAVREKAEHDIAQLKTACEFLMQKAGNGAQSHPRHPQKHPVSMPVGGSPRQTPARRTRVASQWAVAPISNSGVLTSFLIAAMVMLGVILLCSGSLVSENSNKTAKLRVLSVPWCYVEIDGKPMGSSGQAEARALQEGRHRFVLRRDNMVLSRSVYLPKDSLTIIKVGFEEGTIDVSRE